MSKQAATFLAFIERTVKAKLTPAQRVLIKVVFDRVNPGKLAGLERDLARQLFGDFDVTPDDARKVFALLKGARIGGTWLCALYLLYRALVADLSGLAAGEQAFGAIIAPDMKLARQALRYAHGLAKSVPAIKQLIASETADGFLIRRADGREVSIEALAAGRGGKGQRGRSLVAAVMDEASFFFDAESGVINDSEVFRALVVRVLPGGVLCVLSTAWLKTGLLMELIDKNHGAPTTALAAIAPTTLVRTDSPELAVIIAEERERDPDNASREFDCIPLSGGASTFIDPVAIDAMINESLPLVGAA